MASGAAKRYTQAIFGLAKEKGNFDQWQSELGRLDSFMSDSRAAFVLASPNVSTIEKQNTIDAVLAGASAEVHNLAKLLLQRGRLEELPEISRLFQEAVLRERGIAIAEVTT